MSKWIVFIIYLLITGLVNYFHEPWRDETHTWLLARDLNIGALFDCLITEGAMPLWPLLLALIGL